MWVLTFQALALIFQFSLLGAIAYIIIKKGKLRVVTQIKYIYKRIGNRLNISYKIFNGFEYYYFRFKKHELLSISYDVTVEEGSFTLEWRDRKELLFKKKFTENEIGTFTFTTKHRIHSLKVIGEQTKGGCGFKVSKVQE
ncbi:hypothetical protein [Sporosarcina sp. FSL K6-1508]|uniref:hypothetical protein n=1 Tax=Sporosarcina sp. FSL K6-1508 TaxID=2921553 RepID=UPI0030F7400F